MSLHRFWIGPLLVAVFAAEGSGGIFKRTPKPDPAEHVPALIKTLKSDPDDRKRSNAADELRDYDPKTFPDMLPVLIEALENDSSTSVRMEVVNTIGKIRPVSQTSVYALEQAEKNDSAWRVRQEARNVLFKWLVVDGIHRGKPPENKSNQTEEPPLAPPLTGLKGGLPSKTTPPAIVTPAIMEKEPRPMPPSPPLMPTPSATKPNSPRPLLPLLPTRNVKPESKPAPKPLDEGPSLNSPM